MATKKKPNLSPRRTLAENTKFASILRQCRRPQDPPPHLIAFVDPIGLFREFSKSGDLAIRIALGFLPMLGLDGVAGGGITLTFAAGEFDDLAHYHLLLGQSSLWRAAAAHVRIGRQNAATFRSVRDRKLLHRPMQSRLCFTNASEELVDKLLGKGTFEKQFGEKATERLDVNLRTDIIDNLAGRVSCDDRLREAGPFPQPEAYDRRSNWSTKRRPRKRSRRSWPNIRMTLRSGSSAT